MLEARRRDGEGEAGLGVRGRGRRVATSSTYTLYPFSHNQASLGGSPGSQAAVGGSLGLVSMDLISVENGRWATSPSPVLVDLVARDSPTEVGGPEYGSWEPPNHHPLWLWWFEAAGEPWEGFSEGLWELALSLGHFTCCDTLPNRRQ